MYNINKTQSQKLRAKLHLKSVQAECECWFCGEAVENYNFDLKHICKNKMYPYKKIKYVKIYKNKIRAESLLEKQCSRQKRHDQNHLVNKGRLLELLEMKLKYERELLFWFIHLQLDYYKNAQIPNEIIGIGNKTAFCCS